jgi:SAM-dependent methyltransferase
MLARTLEPELMDTDRDARQYDAMDHAAVNERFVTDLIAAMPRGRAPLRVAAKPPHGDDVSFSRDAEARRSGALTVLDLGAGTAQIPIELCRRAPGVRVVAVDAAQRMLAVARENVATAGLVDRIDIVLADAKRLPFASGRYPVVISNSILHHIAEPATVIAEAIRVAAPGGLLFHRDLARPDDEAELDRIVATYAAGATPLQRKLFADSLHAAITLEEVRDLVAHRGFSPDTVQRTSDRHWTWLAERS